MAAPLDAQTRRAYSSKERQACGSKSCFATFEGGPAQKDEIRHCNRAGPDGGHTHRWDGERWQVVGERMQHDRR